MKLKATFLATTALFAAGAASAVDVTAYGQVNKLVASVDNGVDSNTAIVDNDASSTRFGFKAQQQLENGLVVSGLLELQSESNSSSSITANDEQNEEKSSISERHSRIGLSSKYGTFMIGKTSESTDGIAEMDLGGVSDVMYSDVTSLGGAVEFVKKDGTGTTVTISDLYSNADGGRTNLVRYDSPAINGVSASTSMSSGGDIAVALKYNGGMTDYNGQSLLKIKAGIGYKKIESEKAAPADEDRDVQVSGSVSALHTPTGLAATVAMGKTTNDDSAKKDADFMYTKLSYLPVNSNFEYAVDYATSENADGQELQAYGAGAQYNIAKGVSTSVMFRQFDADKAGSDIDDIQVMSAGLKLKF